MKQYLLDTSVVLDLLLNRPPWAAPAAHSESSCVLFSFSLLSLA
jgi:predicted nucleic acid-binding protein